MLRAMGTGPGPTTLAAAGAAGGALSRRPAPTAPVPMPMPPRNPRRRVLFRSLGSLVEFTRCLPFRALVLNMVVELKSIYQKGWGGGVGREYLGFERCCSTQRRRERRGKRRERILRVGGGFIVRCRAGRRRGWVAGTRGGVLRWGGNAWVVRGYCRRETVPVGFPGLPGSVREG